MSDDTETLMDNIRLCIHQDEEPSWFDYAACERVVADALHKARVGPDGKHLERKRVRLYYADLPQVEGRDEAYLRQCPFCPDGRLLLSRGKDTRIVPNDMCIGCGQSVEYLDVNQIEPGGSEGPLG